MKRILDFVVALLGSLIASPILLPVIFLVWVQDRQSPFYIARRVGKDGRLFGMVKLRSMVVNADKNGVASTSNSDARITPIGHFIRNYKLDELTQLWNVLLGDMSLVGPRPNVQSETDLYTNTEKKLLSVKPGITDFSSIIFSDEGNILAGRQDPDLSYNQLIRPWKSRLGLIYITHQSMWLDIQLVLYTIIAIASKSHAISWIVKKLDAFDAGEDVIQVSRRDKALVPHPPPGTDQITTARG